MSMRGVQTQTQSQKILIQTQNRNSKPKNSIKTRNKNPISGARYDSKLEIKIQFQERDKDGTGKMTYEQLATIYKIYEVYQYEFIMKKNNYNIMSK